MFQNISLPDVHAVANGNGPASLIGLGEKDATSGFLHNLGSILVVELAFKPMKLYRIVLKF